jgi:molecular chaperone Hsp33
MGAVLDHILHQHAYPQPVAELLAEAIVIAAALSSSLKYEGVFTLQTKGDGVVRLLIVDVTSDGGIRAYAQYDKDKIGKQVSLNKLIGKGYLAFTCAMTGKDERYQGIVSLEGESLAEAVQHYFRQSEQLPTGIACAVDCDPQNRWQGGCLLLQHMPREGGLDVECLTPEAEDWTRAMIVMATCTPQELTNPNLEANELLYRLFHEEGVRVYHPQALRHQCRCSQARVEAMLRALPHDQIEDLTVNGLVTVTCEFCNKSYVFDEKQRQSLFTAS